MKSKNTKFDKVYAEASISPQRGITENMSNAASALVRSYKESTSTLSITEATDLATYLINRISNKFESEIQNLTKTRQ